MAGKIFINYRRAESLKDARHLAMLLDRGSLKGRIYIDLKGLDGAPDWLHELERQVAASDVMISLVCPGWVEVRDADGKRRIDNDKDFVRFELAEAFRRNIPVVPVLVDGARMPRGSELPDNLLYLTRPQAELLRAESFEADVAKIGKRVQGEIAARRKRGVPGWAVGAASAGALASGVAMGAPVAEYMGWYRPVATDAGASARIAQLRGELADADAAARSAQTARLKAETDFAAAQGELRRSATERDAARKDAADLRTLNEKQAKELTAARAEADAAAKRIADALAAQARAEKAQTDAVAKRQADAVANWHAACDNTLSDRIVWLEGGSRDGVSLLLSPPSGSFMSKGQRDEWAERPGAFSIGRGNRSTRVTSYRFAQTAPGKDCEYGIQLFTTPNAPEGTQPLSVSAYFLVPKDREQRDQLMSIARSRAISMKETEYLHDGQYYFKDDLAHQWKFQLAFVQMGSRGQLAIVGCVSECSDEQVQNLKRAILDRTSGSTTAPAATSRPR